MIIIMNYQKILSHGLPRNIVTCRRQFEWPQPVKSSTDSGILKETSNADRHQTQFDVLVSAHTAMTKI